MTPRRWMMLAGEGIGRTWLLLVLFFLYLPIAVLALMGFNDSVHYTLPFEFTTRWYEDLAHNDRLLGASLNSVLVALANTVIATALGTMAALAFARYRFRGRSVLQLLLFPPITIPWLIIGTSMLVLFFWTGIGRGLHSMLLGHVALSLPYVIIVVGARLASMRAGTRGSRGQPGCNAVAVACPCPDSRHGTGHCRRRPLCVRRLPSISS